MKGFFFFQGYVESSTYWSSPDRFHPMEAELDRMLKLEQLINDHLRDVNQVISPYHEEVALLAEGGLALGA